MSEFQYQRQRHSTAGLGNVSSNYFMVHAEIFTNFNLSPHNVIWSLHTMRFLELIQRQFLSLITQSSWGLEVNSELKKTNSKLNFKRIISDLYLTVFNCLNHAWISKTWRYKTNFVRALSCCRVFYCYKWKIATWKIEGGKCLSLHAGPSFTQLSPGYRAKTEIIYSTFPAWQQMPCMEKTSIQGFPVSFAVIKFLSQF